VIPADLLPRWRDLLALAWLVAGRFRVLARVPVLSSVVRGVSWPTFLVVLAAARGGGRLAAWQTAATAIVTSLPARRRWRGGAAALVAMPVAVVVLLLPFLLVTGLAVAAVVVGAEVLGRWMIALAPVAFVAPAVLGAIAAVAGLRECGHRVAGRRWAVGAFPRLVEASTLAADPLDRQAATRLVIGLLRVADRQQCAVLVQARDDRLAELYRRLGFRMVPAGGSLVLCRPPRVGSSMVTRSGDVGFIPP
jgi:hypothetical protein